MGEEVKRLVQQNISIVFIGSVHVHFNDLIIVNHRCTSISMI